MKDRLIYEEVSITHARYFLHEVDRVELQVIGRLFNLCSCHAVARPSLHIKLFVELRHVDIDKVFDVLGILELVLIDYATLFELG